MSTDRQRSRLTALLGPTNTGKTHYAIDRMLGHGSGMIGFPLRLLARENYDRVVALRGRGRTALVTGEEKILPPRADYFLCTVESMPVDRRVEFLAIDEVQMCADPERGHVFTDRLLNARGTVETMFLGAETMRPIIQALVPGVAVSTRPRLSRLAYAGPRKLTKLKRRSAVVAFSLNEVYEIADLMRRQCGGAAVVLGALSPRTRNAQVELYQSGDVDFLVATDAIGMGLNMDIDHVAFAGIRKFDGRVRRRLGTAEIAQIAGRAGRHMNDGTFGPIAEIGPFEDDLVSAVEDHRFERVRGISWRNGDLDFGSPAALRKSLDARPGRPELLRARDADDRIALERLAGEERIRDRARSPDMVRLLWEVCQIPDFRQTTADIHATLLARIFGHLAAGGGLPVDWVARQVTQLDRVDGNIDALMARIAHVRTWTYIAHRADWFDDAEPWQERTREIEDRLSDALHHNLTQRFVDRRTTVLARARRRDDLSAVVGDDGEVSVEGEHVGRLDGFCFFADSGAVGQEGRALRAAAGRALRGEIEARLRALVGAGDADFAVRPDGGLVWSGAVVARLAGGTDILSPEIRVRTGEHLASGQRDRIGRRLSDWLQARLAADLGPLLALRESELQGVARGLAYRVAEGLGSMPRAAAHREIRDLGAADRASLRSCGIVIGAESLFVPALVKPAAAAWRALLWSLYADRPPTAPPAPGRVTVPAGEGFPEGFLEACGYRALGGRAVRIDVLERLAVDLRRQSRAGALDVGAAQLNLLGLSLAEARPVLEAMGYAAREEEEGKLAWEWAGRSGPRKTAGGRRKSRRRADDDSPFAKLRELNFS